jgi:ubiquinone/menaquinone biosynthesis C-methylase UbiE/mono/diheme cytochrome c family protein
MTCRAVVIVAGLLALVPTSVRAQLPPPAPEEVARGRQLFHGAGRCLSCHVVDGAGGHTARDLSWIGLLRTPDKLAAALGNTAWHAGDAAGPDGRDAAALVAYLRTLRTLWTLPEGVPPEREIAPATENAPFFDRPNRDQEERPGVLIDALAIQPGAVIADIGSGTGYFTWRLAEKTGPGGRVYAIDIQQEMLDLTRQAVERRKVQNVEYRLAPGAELGLPDRSVDLAFVAYAYHEFADPDAMLASIRRALKPGGRMVVLEYAKESNVAPASPLHRMSFEEIRREIEPRGFVVDQLLDFLPVQHGVVFTIK